MSVPDAAGGMAVALHETLVRRGGLWFGWNGEIGTDDDHVHLLVQSVPTASPSELVQTIKSITAKHIFQLHPEVKRMLWGGEFWTKGYYANTVGQYATADVVQKYVQNQGKKYTRHYQNQPTLFESAG